MTDDKYANDISDYIRYVVNLEYAVKGLLEWAERHHAGDPNLDPEEYYAIRDFARLTLTQKREI